MKRYPHTAVIKIETVSEGPLPEATTENLTIEGRYEPSSQNVNLDQSAKFYCPRLDVLDEDPNALNGKQMEINGRFIGISQAWNYQTHCELWLD